VRRRALPAVVALVAVVAVAAVLALRGDDPRPAARPAARAATGDPALAVKARRLLFYDWEPNVIGPGGRSAPRDAAVTGGPRAGTAGALDLYTAVLRAAARLGTPAPDNGRPTSVFYAVDGVARRAYGRGAATRDAALAAVPPDRRATVSVLEVEPDTAIVAAEGSRVRFYVLRDDVALRGRDIRNPRRATDPATGREVVLFDFTPAGGVRFRRLTRVVAQRGASRARERVRGGPAAQDQHYAVVLDGQIVTVPVVDFRRSPDGLDPSGGSRLPAALP
jgi:SecD/SecF fusion protein